MQANVNVNIDNIANTVITSIADTINRHVTRLLDFVLIDKSLKQSATRQAIVQYSGQVSVSKLDIRRFLGRLKECEPIGSRNEKR